MANTIIESVQDSKRVEALLGMGVPTYRQAYSDRTAWIMARLSELAYIKFNPINENRKSTLFRLFDLGSYDHKAEREKLESELDILSMKLRATFDSDGTQAILIWSSKFIVLAFRGTEATSIKDIRSSVEDIKSGIKIKLVQSETGGKIHMGFKDAFDDVASEIQEKINDLEFRDLPLFITGHSLGGALASVAAKRLSHEGGIAGCYTFGSPRVGNEEWVANIKTPMYRLVNAADCVTMLPPGILKYAHCGNMRYLTNCAKGKYDDVKLLYSVGFIRRMKGIFDHGIFYRRVKGWFFSKKRGKHFQSDHSIAIYREKLMIIAEKRNLKK